MSENQPQPSSNPPPSTEPRFDHIAKVRQLVWSLKESLSNLMKISATHINRNSSVDSGQKATDEKVGRIDKALEDFFSIFNQIELHLKIIQECAIQQRQSQKYMPFTVSNLKSDTGLIDPSPNNTISYQQYLNAIENQTKFTENLEKLLVNGTNRG